MANLAPKFCCLPEASRVPPISDEPTDMHNPSAPPIESFSLTGSSIQSTNARHQLCKQLVSKSEQSTEKSHQTSSTASKVTKNINRYFDNQPLSVSTVPDAVSLLQAAEKIMASELINICLQFILQNVNQNNVLYVYHHLKHYSMHSADSHEDENLWNELLNSCLEIIDIHIENIMESKDFTKLDTATMRDIISRKTLKISSKQKILEALDRWASCNCKCCLLLNQGDFPVLGEKLMCSHHIVPKEPSQNRIPLKTINNIITNSVNTPIQNNCCQSHKNESQISYVHNSLDVGKSSNTSSTVAVRKNSGAKRRMSTSRKLIHGLNDILGYAIKIFD